MGKKDLQDETGRERSCEVLWISTTGLPISF